MQLKQLLDKVYNGQVLDAFKDIEVEFITADSRKVAANSLFIARSGMKYDGGNFIDMAVEKGAKVIVSAKEVQSSQSNSQICYLKTDNPDQFLRQIAQKFYGNLSEKIKVIGITGTNGKTTISYLLESILREAGKESGLIGTINHRIGNKRIPSFNTTPSLLENLDFLSEMIQEGIPYCIMEVSSHALDQGRVDLIDFHSAVFTNLTQDHLDYHKSLENYFSAKSKLFTQLSSDAVSIINIDDNYGKKLVSKTSSKIITYGINKSAQVMAKDIQLSTTATQFKLVTPQDTVLIKSNLLGLFNVYNILAAVSFCLNEDISLDIIKRSIEHLKQVPGRLEKIDYGQDFTILIDYAHTHDALENVLRTIKDTCDSKIILVFGCGGDRDQSKRFKMGKVASRLADYSIVTSDNPRSEDPEVIIEQITKGFKMGQYEVEVDRFKAIEKALTMAEADDIVLIAGKGHENYQIFKERTIKFDERRIIKDLLQC
ncbi:MAG: UDP-N-acetylmuramoyl-L-alanyl-D-glutamate--2,6-diaminopimelate ligase [Candidatus Omnitrophica bacterium]|nr:UDP-N-acetylmuramoyl-L-alanyl-D-glutamate--2,6-diaminopimelate ligase [Candidatus Omnitrophota bacterium]